METVYRTTKLEWVGVEHKGQRYQDDPDIA